MVRRLCLLFIICFILEGFSLMQDFYPLAVGNWWQYETKTGSERHEIIALHNDTFMLEVTQRTISGTYTHTKNLVSHDSLASVNKPCGRTLGCMWGPHFVLPSMDTLNTPMGTFHQTYEYGVVWGHPSGGNRNAIVAPGSGPVAHIWTSMMLPPSYDTFALVQDYHLEEVPTGYEHTWLKRGSEDPESSFVYIQHAGDTCEIVFRMQGNGCGEFLALTSYNPAHNCLRIYVADTTHTLCYSTAYYDHSIKIKSLDSQVAHKAKIYEHWYDQDDSIHTRLDYEETIPKTSRALSFMHYDRYLRVACRPNPFSSNVTISTSDNTQLIADHYRIGIYDINGRFINRLSAKSYQPFHITWNGRDYTGRLVGPGTYLVRLKTGQQIYWQKILFLP